MTCLPDRARSRRGRRDHTRWCRKALSAASVGGVLLVVLALLLFTPAAAIAGQSDSIWRSQPNDPAALSKMYDVNQSAMQTTGAPYAQWTGQGRQFLAFDPRGSGRIVEVFGDLEVADRIAVLVPGVANRADNFNTGLGDVRDRAPAVQALALYDATRAAAPSQHAAVIGSPGMGVTRAADLHASARIWAVQSAQDWINWVPAFQVWGAGHGTMPTTPGFGDRVFGTGGVTDHGHYLRSGTQSLANIVEIVLGRDTSVSAPDSSAGPGQASG